MSGLWVMGVDLGQAHDYTAIAVAEAHGTEFARRTVGSDPDYVDAEGRPMPSDRHVVVQAPPCFFDVKHLERLDLGTPYGQVVERVAELLDCIPADATLAVDATGVGRPVVDSMWQAGLRPVSVTITAGAAARGGEMEYSVPKADLVAVLSVALQGHRLRVARELPAAQALLTELLAFRAKVSVAGRATYEAWRSGDRDDLVLALAIAAWVAEHEIKTSAAEFDAIVRATELAAQLEGEYDRYEGISGI